MDRQLSISFLPDVVHQTFELLKSETIAATGYSELARLAEVRPDIVKVDRLLVQNCDADRHRRAVVAGLVRIDAELGVKVVAEGVDRLEKVWALQSAGVHFVHGFYFAGPLFKGIVRDGDIGWTDR